MNGKILAMMSSKGNFVVNLSKETVDDLMSNANGERFDPDMESNVGVVRRSGLVPSAGRLGIRPCSNDQRAVAVNDGEMERPIGIEPTPEPWQGSHG